MEVRTSLDAAGNPPCSLALGTFDGLHRGHMAVIRAALDGPWEPQVFTFSQSPSGEQAVITRRDKRKLLERVGVQKMFSVDFAKLRNMQAEVFVRLLLNRLNARRLCCGEDFRFGQGALGDVKLLEQLCAERNTELLVVQPVMDGGEKVSSTRIRQAVAEGDMRLAWRLLGRPFGFSLEVIHGNHIGTGLGTPTINQALPEDFALPEFGVYAAWCRIGGKFYYGVCNVGVKPTVGSDRVLAETWMPDFSGDLYGKRVRLYLLDFIRPERKFSSLEELKEEIGRNARQAKEIARALPPESFEETQPLPSRPHFS